MKAFLPIAALALFSCQSAPVKQPAGQPVKDTTPVVRSLLNKTIVLTKEDLSTDDSLQSIIIRAGKWEPGKVLSGDISCIY